MPIVPDSSATPATDPQADARDDLLLIPLIPVLRDARWGWRRAAFVALAVVLILLGFATVPVPLASGVIFWIPGVLMLSIAIPPVARWLNRLEHKLPDRWRRRLRPKLWYKARRKLRDAVRAP